MNTNRDITSCNGDSRSQLRPISEHLIGGEDCHAIHPADNSEVITPYIAPRVETVPIPRTNTPVPSKTCVANSQNVRKILSAPPFR